LKNAQQSYQEADRRLTKPNLPWTECWKRATHPAIARSAADLAAAANVIRQVGQQNNFFECLRFEANRSGSSRIDTNTLPCCSGQRKFRGISAPPLELLLPDFLHQVPQFSGARLRASSITFSWTAAIALSACVLLPGALANDPLRAKAKAARYGPTRPDRGCTQRSHPRVPRPNPQAATRSSIPRTLPH